VFILIVVASAVAGLAIGSFLNVVVYRVPAGRSVVAPRSACPRCETPIAPRDNLPVVSWLLLRGRCRTCLTSISVRYPAIEALTGALFALIAVRLGASWSLLPELAFVAGLIALASVDLERLLLPRAILYPTLALVAAGSVVAAAATGRWERLGVAALCGAAAFAFFFLVQSARPRWMGFGDVRLAALIGLALGWLGPWYVLVGLMAANLAGALIGLGLVAAGRATRATALPYGVFLAVGSLFALLAGSSIVSWYSHHLAS
jgi:leader peptidase (prepilin peptidase)/N-methyltransferase